MKNLFNLLKTGVIIAAILTGCDNEIIDIEKHSTAAITTRSVPTVWFDWENADWMPTPTGQSPIPSPWVGQGSIASTYGLDIVEDRKAIDGWELLYSTFDPNGVGQLINPYFILYNKYRGIMRIFIYITTQFVAQSSNIQDAISIISNQPTTILRFLGTDLIDATVPGPNTYEQLQPIPLDGSLPLAANKWHMMQYELAYDPNIASIPYNQIQLNWRLNYYNVDSISLGGDIVGQLKGTIGSTQSDFFAGLSNPITTIGSGTLAIVGQSAIVNHTSNPETGANNMGINPNIFKSIYDGISSAVTSSIESLPGAIGSFLSGIFGGASTTTPICLNLSANFSITGSSIGAGSFPSSPTSMWMPGTDIPSSALGYIPLYNELLGVINFNGKPQITFQEKAYVHREYDMEGHDYLQTDSYLYPPSTFDYSQYIQINPVVSDIANIEIVKQDLVTVQKTSPNATSGAISINRDHYFFTSDGSSPEFYLDCYVRFCIKVTPKNGGAESMIVKTFKLDCDWETEIVSFEQ